MAAGVAFGFGVVAAPPVLFFGAKKDRISGIVNSRLKDVTDGEVASTKDSLPCARRRA